ncbi:MAG: class I SAM-dependent methyltransferase [Oligoflexia bacterium]|nr:class I SAM-dependent methyltransferase [Oligoflexia bacterium]
MAKRSYEYLLGDSRREATRLRAQGKLWDPVTHALFDRLGIRPGWKVLEIGPGQGSLNLELRRRTQRPVDAVERSPEFARRLRKLWGRDSLGQATLWNCDLLDARLPASHYDLIFARWVFLFLPDPLAHLKRLIRALKPGGVIALQDYHRETLAMLPPAPHWQDFLEADRAFFASQGGNASIGASLPVLLQSRGLKLVELTPHVKTGHPGSATWSWLSDYFLGVLDRYARYSPFSPAKARALRRRWLAAASDRTSLLIGPTVLDVVARKKR